MTEFLIKDTCVFETRKLFGLIGDILSGDCKEGMTLLPQSGVGAGLIINSVEEIRGKAESGITGLLLNTNMKMNWIF